MNKSVLTIPWRLVLVTALDAVVVMDREGKVLDWNDNATAVFGWAADEVRDRLMADFITTSVPRGACPRTAPIPGNGRRQRSRSPHRNLRAAAIGRGVSRRALHLPDFGGRWPSLCRVSSRHQRKKEGRTTARTACSQNGSALPRHFVCRRKQFL